MFLEGQSAFGLAPAAKEAYLSAQLTDLLVYHRAACPEYARLVEDWEQHPITGATATERYPFVPVTVFKEHDLRSTRDEGITVRSSSTTGAGASRIFVDKPTRKRQSLSANWILSDFIGAATRPYLVFDAERTVRGAESLSARGAAILSLSHLASEFFFVARESAAGQLELDRAAFDQACATIADRPFIAYGFTHVLYRMHAELGGLVHMAHPESVLLHSGGWKRMTGLAVDKAAFNERVAGVWGLPAARVIDFYGTVEQVGILYRTAVKVSSTHRTGPT